MKRLLLLVVLLSSARLIAGWIPSSSPNAGLRAVPMTFATQDTVEYDASWLGGIHICTIFSNGSQFKDLKVYGEDPAFSFDGLRIAYVARDGVEPTELFVMNSDGSHKERLTHGQTWVRLPAWSPDGKKIAFVGLQRVGKSDNFKSAIYLINSDGTGLRQLTDIDIGPTWSPDGRVVAFVGRDGESYAVKQVAENLRQLTGMHVGAPAWAPDGNSLAFTGLEGSSPEIFVIEVATSALRPLTHLKGISTSPTWSPDGGQVAFAFDDIQSSRIFVVNASDANAHELLGSKSLHYYQPAWSPNGKEMAITAERNIGSPHSREHAVAPLAHRWIVILDLETLTTHPLKELSAGHPSFARGWEVSPK